MAKSISLVFLGSMDGGEQFFEDSHEWVDLSDEDQSSSFFSSILTRSETALNSALAKIDASVRIWADQASLKDDNASKLLRCHLPTVLRLSLVCPVKEVRACFSKLLNDLEVRMEVSILS